jgi:Phage T7 tail fibre protein
MAYSYEVTTADGSSQTVNVPFGYLDKSHVHVYLNDNEVSQSSLVWLSRSSIQLPTIPTAGIKKKVKRITPASAPLVTFVSGHLSVDDLNNEALQLLYLAEEGLDEMGRSLVISEADNSTVDLTLPDKATRAGNVLGFDANGKPIAAVTTPATIVSSAMAPVFQAASVLAGMNKLLEARNANPLMTPYTMQATDAGKVIGLNGYFGVTWPNANTFENGDELTLVNIGSRGVKQTNVETNAFYLYPGQIMKVFVYNGAYYTSRDRRWKLTSGTAFYVDPNGNDANDGLASGSASANARQGIETTWDLIRDFTDGPASMQLTLGATYDLGASGQALVGDASSGFGRLIGILGDPSLANPPVLQCRASAPGFAFRDGGWASINGVKWTTIGNNTQGAVNLSQTGLADLQNCIWGNFPLGYAIQVADGAHTNITAAHKFVAGSSVAWLFVESGSKAVISAQIDGQSAAYAFSDAFIQMDLQARIQLGGTTMANMSNFTGPQYSLTNASFLSKGGVSFPAGLSSGNADGTSLAY